VIADQAVNRAQEVTDIAQRTAQTSHNGQRAVQETMASMGRIKGKVEDIAENILALSAQTQQIGQIITTVNDLATQSNMLALNAAVEAARAGSRARVCCGGAGGTQPGEQSRQATAQVRTILEEIQRATNATVMATEEGSKGVEEGYG